MPIFKYVFWPATWIGVYGKRLYDVLHFWFDHQNPVRMWFTSLPPLVLVLTMGFVSYDVVSDMLMWTNKMILIGNATAWLIGIPFFWWFMSKLPRGGISSAVVDAILGAFCGAIWGSLIGMVMR